MSLYYEDEYVELHHGDALDEIAWLNADVLVSDVPYGIDYNSGSRRLTLPASILGDKDTIARDTAIHWWRERNGLDAPALIFGTWRIPRPTGTRALLVWDTKGALGMGDLSIPWKPSHQEVYVLGTGFHGRRDSDVITAAPVQSMGTNGRVHPHQKPIALMEALIAKCPEGVIADPFAGSGSTLIAARNLGRKVIGVELEERYCELIVKRLSQQAFDFSALEGQAS
jgi:hypothetical protein